MAVTRSLEYQFYVAPLLVICWPVNALCASGHHTCLRAFINASADQSAPIARAGGSWGGGGGGGNFQQVNSVFLLKRLSDLKIPVVFHTFANRSLIDK